MINAIGNSYVTANASVISSQTYNLQITVQLAQANSNVSINDQITLNGAGAIQLNVTGVHSNVHGDIVTLDAGTETISVSAVGTTYSFSNPQIDEIIGQSGNNTGNLSLLTAKITGGTLTDSSIVIAPSQTLSANISNINIPPFAAITGLQINFSANCSPVPQGVPLPVITVGLNNSGQSSLFNLTSNISNIVVGGQNTLLNNYGWTPATLANLAVNFTAVAYSNANVYIGNLIVTVYTTTESVSDAIDLTNFNFNTTSNATTQGVSISAFGYSTAPCTLTGQLIYQGQALGSSESLTLPGNGNTSSTLTFGGLNDLLNSKLSPAILNDPTFGVRFRASSLSNCQVFLDAATLTAYSNYSLTSNINFGSSVCSSADGDYLFVSATNVSNIGQIAVYQYTSTQQHNYSNVSNIVLGPAGVCQVVLNDNVAPDNAYSLRVTVTDSYYNMTNQILIPNLEYSLNSNVITFITPISTFASVTVEQTANYYNYITSVTDSVIGSGFGTSISCNEDGTSIAVGSPLDNTTYIFSRLIEKSYSIAPQTFYQRQTTTGKVIKILVNGVELNASDYVALENAQYINFNNPLPINCLLQIEYDQFILQQTLIGTAQTMFGDSVALQHNQLVIGAPQASNQIDATTIIRQGAANFYVLDTATTNTKTVLVSALSLSAGLTFYINGFVATTIDSTPESLVSVINATTTYSGVSATYNSNLNTITLSIAASQHTNGIIGKNSALSALYSTYVLFQTLLATDQTQTMFGENIKWIASDLFTVQVNTGSALVKSSEITFADNTSFDSNVVNFYDQSANESQTLIIYQVLTSNRDWVGNYSDIVQVTPIKIIQVDGSNPNLFFDGNINNLWIGDANSPLESLTLYNNQLLLHGWSRNNSAQTALEARSITAAWIYDSTTNTKLVDLELVDLATGILPSSIEKMLDYIADLDPAYYGTALWAPGNYNIGDRVIFNNKLYQALIVLTPIDIYFDTNNWQLVSDSDVSVSRGATVWGAAQLGQYWFDTGGIKIVDAQLGNVDEHAINWNTWFPETKISIREWVASNVPPAQYASSNFNGYASGTSPYVFDINAGRYYFWVSGKTSSSSKYNVSSADVAASLSNLPNSGIAMISPIDKNKVAVWNVGQYVVGYHAVLHVDYITSNSNAELHSEFLLLSNNGEKSWLSTSIYNKFVDSLSGQTDSGATVPAIGLQQNQQYGTTFTPVRTIFADRCTALYNYFQQVNTQLANVAIASSAVTNMLSAVDPIPSYGYSETVPDRNTLNSLDITAQPINYRVLIQSDNTLQNNSWSIVSKTINNVWAVVQHEAYNLPALWTYADWQSNNAAPNISTISPTYTINNAGEFESVSMQLGGTLGILNQNNNYAIYQNNVGNVSAITDLDLIYLQNGTIQFLPTLYDFSSSNIGFDSAPFDQIRNFDDDPAAEVRLATTALNEQILVGELSTAADSAFFTALNYAIQENKNLDWMFKTSFVTVDYNKKNLDQQQFYTATDDTTMQNFITETLPFHTRVREFVDVYSSVDTSNTVIADFDIPAIYDQLFVDSSQGVFNGISPVRSPDGSQLTDSTRLTQDVYQNWNNYFTYSISNISVVNSGANYATTPQITITGGGGAGATAVAVIDPSTQKIVEVNVTNPGYGFTSTPTVTASATGSNTVPAILYPELTNALTRKFSTGIRFDRIGYTINTFDPTTLMYGNVYGYPANSIVYSSNLNSFFIATTNYPAGNLNAGNITGWAEATDREIAESTALNRIYQLYNGSNITPANNPALLMSGLYYPDSHVTDFPFIQSYLNNTMGEIYNVDDINLDSTVLNLNFDPAEINNTSFNSQLAKFGDYCGEFSEFTGQYITLDLLNSKDTDQLVLDSADFTMEFFCRFSSTEIQVTSNDNTIIYEPAEMVLVDMRTNQNTNGLYVYKTIDNCLAVGIGLNTVPLLKSTSKSVNLSSNAWQNIVIQRSDSLIKLYLDGNQIASNPLVEVISPNSTGLTFGADYTGQNVMNGYIDEFRLTVNMLRYNFVNAAITVPTTEFSRSIYTDPYFGETYTKVLYGFEGFVNEAQPNLVFVGVNGAVTINDLSWNPKSIYLINYVNGKMVVNGKTLGNVGTPQGMILTANLVNNLGMSPNLTNFSIGGVNTSNSNISLVLKISSNTEAYISAINVGDSMKFANTSTPLDGNSFIVSQVNGNVITLNGGTLFSKTGFGQLASSNITIYSNGIISNIANGATQITSVNNLYVVSGTVTDSNLFLSVIGQVLTANIIGLSAVPANANITGISFNFNSSYSGSSVPNLSASLNSGGNAHTYVLSTSTTTYSSGSNIDLWNFNNWTPTSISNLAINFTPGGVNNVTIDLNNLTANVYYTLPAIPQATMSNLITATSVGAGTPWANVINVNSSVSFANTIIINENVVFSSSNTFPYVMTANVSNILGSANNVSIMNFPPITTTGAGTIYLDFSLNVSNTVAATSNLAFSYSLNNGTTFNNVAPIWTGNAANASVLIPVVGIAGSNLANLQVKAVASTVTSANGTANITATISNVFIVDGLPIAANSQILSANITGLGGGFVTGANISNVIVSGVALNFNAYYVGATANITANLNVGNAVMVSTLTTSPTTYTMGGPTQLWGYNNWSPSTSFSNLIANLVAASNGITTVYVNNLNAVVYYSYINSANGNITVTTSTGSSQVAANLVVWANPKNVSSNVNFSTANIYTSSYQYVTGNVNPSTSTAGNYIGGTAQAASASNATVVLSAASPYALNTIYSNFGTGAVSGNIANVSINVTGTWSAIETTTNPSYQTSAAASITAQWSVNGGNTWSSPVPIALASSLSNESLSGNITGSQTSVITISNITDLRLVRLQFIASGSASSSYHGGTAPSYSPSSSTSAVGIQLNVVSLPTFCTQYLKVPSANITGNLAAAISGLVVPNGNAGTNINGVMVTFNAYYTGAAVSAPQLIYSINQNSNTVNLSTTSTSYTYGNNSAKWGYSSLTQSILNNLIVDFVADTNDSNVSEIYVGNLAVTAYYTDLFGINSTVTSSNVTTLLFGAGNVWGNYSNVNSAVSFANVLMNNTNGFGNVIQTLNTNVNGLNTIPSNATISGITISFNAYQSGANIAPVTMSAGIKNGTEVDTIILPASSSTFTLGSNTDLWGYNWTPQNIANANIVVNFNPFCAGNANVYINNVVANVDYTVPGPNLSITSGNVQAASIGIGQAWSNVSYCNSTVSNAFITFNPQMFSLVNVSPASQLLNSSNVYATGNTYIQTIGDTALNFGTGDFTVEFWYEPLSNSNVQTLFEVSLAQSALQQSFDQSRFVTNFSNNAIQVIGSQLLNPSNIWLALNSGNLAINTPYFISVERQANVFYLYVNGELQSSTANSSYSVGGTIVNVSNIAMHSIPSATVTQISGNSTVQVINTSNAAAVITFGAAYNGTNPTTGIFGDIKVTTNLARHVIGPNSNLINGINGYFDDIDIGTEALSVTIDGGGFVDSITSYSPEETLPGRIFDTLNIQVYQSDSGEVSVIAWSYQEVPSGNVINGTNNIFTLANGSSGGNSINESTLLITLNGVLLSNNVDYTVFGSQNQYVDFTVAPLSDANLYASYGYGPLAFNKIVSVIAWSYQEVPSGNVINGTNNIFTLANGSSGGNSINESTLLITLNGVTLSNNIDYTIFGAKNQYVDFNFAPVAGANLYARYGYGPTTTSNAVVLGFGLFKNPLTQGPVIGYQYTTGAVGRSVSVPWPSLSADSAVVKLNGIVQTDANFVCSNYVLTFTFSFSVGANINIMPTGIVDYFSLGQTAITTLSQPLFNSNASMFLANASGFITPIGSNIGVVLIGGERITYQYISGSVLSGLTRGTYSTGIPNVYPAGTTVISIGSDRKLPGDAGGYTWYTLGSNTASNGQGLVNSNSNIALFLQA